VCVLHERLFDLEFRIISTSIESLEDQVPLPHFYNPARGDGQSSGPPLDESGVFAVDDQTDPALHFVAMITLSRLIRRADEVIRSYKPNLGETELLRQGPNRDSHANASAYLPFGRYTGTPWRLVKELCYQLDCWRNALP
jgi:hypothetical protein